MAKWSTKPAVTTLTDFVFQGHVSGGPSRNAPISLLDARFAAASHTHTFASLTSKPTTLSGFGITDAQPLNAGLTSISALTTASYGRSLLTLADAAAARSSLGLVIDQDVVGLSLVGGAFEVSQFAIGGLANASNLEGEYLDIEGVGETVRFWFSKDGGTSPPADPGRLVEVALVDGDTTSEVFTKLSAAFTADAVDWTVSGSSPTLTITHPEIGERVDATSSTPQITASVFTQGADHVHTLPTLDGSALFALDASAISSGSLDLVRLAAGGASAGQVLTYTGAAWEPAAPAGGSGLTIGSTAITGGTSGRLLLSGATLAELTLGTGVSTALGNAVDAASGLLTYGLIGTSGTKLGLLNTANTWSAAQTLAGGTVTASTPLLNVTQTWNSVGTTFRGVEIAHSITNAAAASTHLRIRGGASGTTDRLTLTEEKLVITGTDSGSRVLELVSTASGGTATFVVANNNLLLNSSAWVMNTGELRASLVGNGSFFCGIGYEQTPNVAYIRPFGSSTLQLGVSAASPVAHLLRGASTRAGTDSNAAGASLTLAGGVGTGTGGGGDLLFQTAPAGSSGSTANTLATRLRITGAGAIGLYGVTPTAQATTGIAAATFAANTSGVANDSATFGGYTIGQVVKALQLIGILA